MGDIRQTWQDKVALKREIREKAISAFEKDDVSAEAMSLTDVGDIAALAQKIATGELTSETVTRAYIQKTIAAHRLVQQTGKIYMNYSVTWRLTIYDSLTEVLFEDALKQAKELDACQVKYGKTVGPLHGVPMTLKDQFDVKGYDTTIGYVGRTFKPAEEDAALVEMLKKLGVVVLAKTNLPQSIMWCETENPLWGLTTNPMSKEYTSGGSTGGESALLKLHGSMMGWGTDIGGSVRIPSHMMGLYGLKPSSARLPYWGVPVSTEGQEHVPSSIGPLARELPSLSLVMKELVSLRPWEFDSRCAPIPWRDDVFQELRTKPLTIGLLVDDGAVRPHPPVSRVMQSVVEKLKAACHDIVEWNADLHPECIQVLDDYYTADGGEDIKLDVAAGGEPFIPHVETLVNKGKPISVYEYWQINRRKIALQQAYMKKWSSIRSPTTGKTVDVLLMPPMPHTAVPHRSCRWVGYTKIWNVLDYSALVLPAGNVKPEDVQTPWEYEARNELDKFNSDVWMKNRDTMAELGLPVGIQLVGKKLEEEKVLAVGAVVDELLRSA